jgi:ATP-dependent Clp protease ATP-binding subunit ClpA
VVVEAQNVARAASSPEISTAHLALGLLTQEDSIATGALTAQGIDLAAASERLRAALPPASEDMPALVPFDVGARKALELTYREALRLGHNYIGTEHILLALLAAEEDGPLTSLGVDPDAAEAHIAQALAEVVASRQA